MLDSISAILFRVPRLAQRGLFWLIFAFILPFAPLCVAAGRADHSSGECTIGVFSGSITDDSRPVLWKNRDVADHDQRFIYYSSYQRNGFTTIPFIGNAYRNDSTKVYMGSNSCGFALVNSDAANLEDSLLLGIDDGTLIRIALETCTSLRDFEALLDSTNLIGRKDCWNMATIDALGNYAVYECRNYSYTKFGSDDSDPPAQNYMIRANFSLSGDNRRSGLDRYKRANDLVAEKLSSSPLDISFVCTSLARDLFNLLDDPYPLPYHGIQLDAPPGYIFAVFCTICNASTSSAVIIRGVAPGEDPSLTTIFAMLGSPVLSVAFPLWVKSGGVPIYLTHPAGAPVYTYCRLRRDLLFDNSDFVFHLNSNYLFNDCGAGVYSYTMPLEAWGIEQSTQLIDSWRSQPPSPTQVQFEQFRIARAIFSGFQLETADFLKEFYGDGIDMPKNLELVNYPNPFNETTRISYSGLGRGPVIISIYDALGRLVQQIHGPSSGTGEIFWNGKDMSGNRAASGIYFYALTSGSDIMKNKMMLLK
jgi:hypothetical protein